MISDLLDREDLKQLLLVLEECRKATSIGALQQVFMREMSERFGYDALAFITADPLDRWDGAATVGAVGISTPHLEEYMEVWSPHEVFASDRAREVILREGAALLDEVSDGLEPDRRAYVEDYLLRKVQFTSGVGCWLPTGLPVDGYFSIWSHGRTPLGQRDKARALALRPHLGHIVTQLMKQGQQPARALASLTPRQREVAELVAAGWSNKEIARMLGLPEQTVKTYVSRVLARSGLKRRSQLAAAVLREPTA